MLTYQRNFNDVYAGRLAGPGECGAFSKNIPFQRFQ
jgi:hypothetical protein